MSNTMSQHPLLSSVQHYSGMPVSQRVLFTATLLLFGFGYLFALINILESYGGRAGGNPAMVTYEDIVVGYSGSGRESALESALGGAMRDMLPQAERSAVIAWAQNGAPPEAYARDIGPIIENRCLTCHNGSDPHLSNLSGYDDVKKLTSTDSGPSTATLVLGSHIHLFGLGFVFFIMGLMFSHAHVRPLWLKCTLIGLPFLSTASDISSWYLVRLYHPFALVVIGSGAIMAACFAIMWVITMYQLWFYSPHSHALALSD